LPQTNLGVVPTSQDKLGLVVFAGAPNTLLDGNCQFGQGIGYAANDLAVTVTDNTHPGPSFAFTASTGAYAGSVFPLAHALGPGTYTITVAFLGGATCDNFGFCFNWPPTSATGTLTVVAGKLP
jgi:hypothetical protein